MRDVWLLLALLWAPLANAAYTFTIDDTGSNPVTPTGSNPVSYTAGADADVTAASINLQLSSANVIVETGEADGGTIVVDSNNLNWIMNALTLAASDSVDLNGNIQNVNGTLELDAGLGSVTQAGLARVNVGSLSVTSAYDAILTNANNVVQTLAGVASHSFSFTSSVNIVVGAVTGNEPTVAGISAGPGGITLASGGDIDVVSGQLTTTGPMQLTSSGAASGTGSWNLSGPLFGESLVLSAPGSSVIDASNSSFTVTTLPITVNGAINLSGAFGNVSLDITLPATAGPDKSYAVLTTTGGISGTFGTVTVHGVPTGDSYALSYAPAASPTQAILTISAPDKIFADGFDF